MTRKIPLIAHDLKRLYTGFLLAAVLLFAVCTYLTQFNPMVLAANGDAFWEFITEDFLPPALPKASRIPGIFSSVLVTLALAMSATTVAAILAFFVALCITSFAFMVRAFVETMEDVSQDCVESLQAVGATFPQRVAQAILPSCLSGFLSWFLYCVEVNIRASTIVGMVGGGGVGLTLFSYIKSFRYDIALTIILLIAAMVIVVDQITGKLRKELLK